MASKINPKYTEGVHFVVQKWGDENIGMHDNYGCANCMFSTLDPVEMNKHLANPKLCVHKWPKVDAEGNEINGKHPIIFKNAAKAASEEVSAKAAPVVAKKGDK